MKRLVIIAALALANSVCAQAETPATAPAQVQQEQKDGAAWLVSNAGAWFIADGPYAGFRFVTDGQGNFSLSLAVSREAGKAYQSNLFGTIRQFGYGTAVIFAQDRGSPVSMKLDVRKVSGMDMIAEAYDASGNRFPFSTVRAQ